MEDNKHKMRDWRENVATRALVWVFESGQAQVLQTETKLQGKERDGGGIKATILISKALEICSCEDQQIFADVSRGKK